ncbi:MAG: hypothetical protein P9M03_09670 [Candidatus Theseobacter exili]|nr:hypothetical protein [Candidatus Theseobacter exili]
MAKNKNIEPHNRLVVFQGKKSAGHGKITNGTTLSLMLSVF